VADKHYGTAISRLALLAAILAALVWAIALSSCHTPSGGYYFVPYVEVAQTTGDLEVTEFRSGMMGSPRLEGAGFDHSFRDFKQSVDQTVAATLAAQEAAEAPDPAPACPVPVEPEPEPEAVVDTPWGPITFTGGAAALAAGGWFFVRRKKAEA
jgi:LPXTG-motif cell wall-anchored protein